MATDVPASALLPPHSIEAEQAVLGAFLLADSTLYEFVVRDGLKPQDFYLPQHRAIFDAILRLYDKSQPTDVLLVAEELRRESALEDVGGVDAVQNLAARVGNVGALREHGRVVRELGMLRRLLGATYEIQEGVQAGREEPEEVVRQAQKAVLEVSDASKSQEFRRIGDILQPELERLEKLESGEISASGTLTGFRDLDAITGGLQPGALVIIAARPAMGKSAFVTNVAENVSMHRENPLPVALFSLEMAERELVIRFMASQASIKGDDIARARLRDRWPKIVQTATRISNAPLYVDDSSDIGVMEIRAKAQRLKMDHPEGIGLIIIDYLQLLRPDGRIESRVQQVGEMSRGLKILASEMECPVVALSQLSRGVESRPDKRPMLSDLRESGNIEQDADLVMFLYRDEYYHEDSAEPGVAELIIAKNRSGGLDRVRLMFQKEYPRFLTMDRRPDGGYQ